MSGGTGGFLQNIQESHECKENQEFQDSQESQEKQQCEESQGCQRGSLFIYSKKCSESWRRREVK